MPQRPDEQPQVVVQTKSYRLEDGLVRNLKDNRTPALTNDLITLNRARVGEGNRQNELKGGQNTFRNDTGALNLRGTDPKTLNRGTLESTAPAIPTSSPPSQTKTPQLFQQPKGYDPSKKKNAGGLSAARQHVVPDFFPGQLDQLKLGPMRIQPIAFKGASPQINLRTVAFQGFLKNQA